MATQRLQLVDYDGGRCTIAVVYDDATLVASAVEASNTSPFPCAVTVTNGVHSASGTLAVGQHVQLAVPAGALTLQPTTVPGQTYLTLGAWQLTTRWPA